ncbi:hypothetical protein C3489_14770 [Streptomyces sp. Ru71]|nr:hypothetical protein C3489_14770 [Streptomyces sp. Ru71]
MAGGPHPGGVPQEGAPDARGETAIGTTHGSGAGTGTTAATTGAAGATTAAGAQEGTDAPLMPHEETDELQQRLSHALAGFVDGPRAAVEEADRVLQEITAHVTDAVSRRRRTLRMSWQGGEAGEDKPATSTDTEQLRLALRDYRELSRRLLRL